ncbi:MAG: MFS transporter [Haloarculaceae archaeon]
MADHQTCDRRPERLFTGYSGRISTVLAVGWMATLLGRQAISPLLPAIMDSLDITPGRAGLALTAMIVLYSLVQYPSGRMSDQLSRTTVVLGSIVVMVAGFGLLAITRTYPGFLVGVAVVGVGAGAFFSPARAFVSDLFVRRRGQALGVQTTAGQVGGILAATSAAVVLSIAGWQFAFLPAIVALCLVGGLLIWWSRDPIEVSPVEMNLYETGVRLFGMATIRKLLVAHVLVTFAITAFMGFLPTLLQVEKGLSPPLASAGFALVYVVGMVSGPVAGRLSDHYVRTVVIVGTLVVGCAGLVVLVGSASRPAMAVGVALTSAGLWGYVPPMTAEIMDRLPDGNLGGDFGFLKMVAGLGGLGPAYVGVVAQRTTYGTAFAGLAVCLLAGAVVVLVTRRDVAT